jgi:hypothetical protein
MNPNAELIETTRGLMIAVGEQAEREELMPYLRRRREPIGKLDLEWNPQLVVFRPEEFIRRARLASVILVPERFVPYIRASAAVCMHMNWSNVIPDTIGLLGHFAGSPVFTDSLLTVNRRNPKDKFLFVGAKYGVFADAPRR